MPKKYATKAEQRHAWREASMKSAWRRLGLSDPPYPRPDRCELCNGLSNGRGRLHYDHDHVTGAFRGWLCSNCNSGLGRLGDTVAGLRRAIAYLERKL